MPNKLFLITRILGRVACLRLWVLEGGNVLSVEKIKLLTNEVASQFAESTLLDKQAREHLELKGIDDWFLPYAPRAKYI